MAYLQINENNKINLIDISFDSDARIFVLSDESKENQLKFSFPLEAKQSNKDDYEIFILFKKDIPNNYIFQVYEKVVNRRIGWIFPLTALITIEHDYAENEHFLNYAFSAFQLLILQGNYEIENSGSFNSDEYFNSLNQDMVIVCLSKEALNNSELPKDFSFDHYLPSLHRYGFSKIEMGSKSDYNILPKRRINISPISKDFEVEPYVNQLYSELIAENHTLVKFHVLYQIIELCLDKILINELLKLSIGIESKEIFVRELRQQLANFEGESDRLRKLFENYLKNTDDFPKNELKVYCQSFLDNCKVPYNGTLNESDIFYKVRNSIVHNYRNIFQNGGTELNQINDVLSHCVSEILINFETK